MTDAEGGRELARVEGVEPRARANDAEAAFADLRNMIERQNHDLWAEMNVMRRGLETLLERRQDHDAPIDYSTDIARLVASVNGFETRLAAIEKAPAIQNGPEHYLKLARETGEATVAPAVRECRDEARASRHQATVLASHFAGSRKRRTQTLRNVGALAIGITVGILAILFGPRFLPETVGRSVALTTLDANGWYAGIALMKAARPEDWRRLEAASHLVRANTKNIAVCANVARQNPQAQRCQIRLPVGWGTEPNGEASR